jgi:hypothetical protein
MGTRAASATFSLRAKEKLVKLLFGGTRNHALGSDAIPIGTKVCPKLLDHAGYSYQNIKAAYYKRIQQLHPDKHNSLAPGQQKLIHNVHEKDQKASTNAKSSNATQFMELQEAWRDYEEYAKMMKKVGEADANFTLFGVGCSFSDSEVEREQRSKIMDQAARGWFSAGALTSSDSNDASSITVTNNTNSSLSRLSSDDMFEIHDPSSNEKSCSTGEADQTTKSEESLKSSLIAHLIPPHKRRTNATKRNFSTFSSSTSQMLDILERVKNHELTPEQAVHHFESSSRPSDKEILQRFAILDHDRYSRTGFPEAVFAESKTPLQVAQILDDMGHNANTTPNFSGQAILATRYVLWACNACFNSRRMVSYTLFGRQSIAANV